MTNENTNKTKEDMTNEEVAELITDYVKVGSTFFNGIKIKLVRRGFILGLLTAVAIQSLATIVILLMMN